MHNWLTKIVMILLGWFLALPCLANDVANREPVKVLFLSPDRIQVELFSELGNELVLAVDNSTFESIPITEAERMEWGDSHERVMQKMYALGLLEDAQVVLDLRSEDDATWKLLMVVLFERFAVGTVETLNETGTPEDVALISRALIIEARDLFIHGAEQRDAEASEESRSRWMQFSIPADLPQTEPEQKTEAAPVEIGAPVEQKAQIETQHFALMPHFSFSTGLVGDHGPSSWFGGGLLFQWAAADHLILLAGVTSQGGVFPSNFDGDVSGYRVEPSLGLGGRWAPGRARALVFAQFKTVFSKTTFSGDQRTTTSSFNIGPGLQAGVLFGWMLSPSWSVDMSAAFNWYWKRYGYVDELEDVDFFTSPWLELTTLVGFGYHF